MEGKPTGAVLALRRFAAIVDSGKLNDLSAIELRVLNVYLRHADNDTGIAYPSIETLAKRTANGDKTRASTARKALVKAGLLELVEKGGGVGKASRYRVVTPETVSDLHTVHSDSNSVGIVTETVSESAANSVVFDHQTVSDSDTRTTQLTTQRTTHTTTQCDSLSENRPGSKWRQWAREMKLPEHEITRALTVHPEAHLTSVQRVLTHKMNAGTVTTPLALLRSLVKPGAVVDETELQPRTCGEGNLFSTASTKPKPLTDDDIRYIHEVEREIEEMEEERKMRLTLRGQERK